MVAVVHQLTEITGSRGQVNVKVACGAKVWASNRADAFREATAWDSLTTCDACRTERKKILCRHAER